MAVIFGSAGGFQIGGPVSPVQRVDRREARTDDYLEEGFAYGRPFRPELIRDMPRSAREVPLLHGASDGPGGLPLRE